MVNLGERIRTLRMEKNITQTDLARRISISKSMVSQYELAERHPSYDVLVKIAAFFGVTTDFLLGLDKKRTISVDGLNDREVQAVNNMIDVLRERK